jgi:hypothetical protein
MQTVNTTVCNYNKVTGDGVLRATSQKGCSHGFEHVVLRRSLISAWPTSRSMHLSRRAAFAAHLPALGPRFQDCSFCTARCRKPSRAADWVSACSPVCDRTARSKAVCSSIFSGSTDPLRSSLYLKSSGCARCARAASKITAGSMQRFRVAADMPRPARRLRELEPELRPQNARTFASIYTTLI